MNNLTAFLLTTLALPVFAISMSQSIPKTSTLTDKINGDILYKRVFLNTESGRTYALGKEGHADGPKKVNLHEFIGQLPIHIQSKIPWTGDEMTNIVDVSNSFQAKLLMKCVSDEIEKAAHVEQLIVVSEILDSCNLRCSAQ